VFTQEDIAAEIEGSSTSEYEILAILREGRFSGYMIVRGNRLTGILHLEYICLRTEERSRGAGKQLITYLSETYREQGYKRIELVVSGENTGAIRFYENNGFSRDSVMKHIIIGGRMEPQVMV
jgi:ribosomal protein S18 acetylase RimI-like enzyme